MFHPDSYEAQTSRFDVPDCRNEKINKSRCFASTGDTSASGQSSNGIRMTETHGLLSNAQKESVLNFVADVVLGMEQEKTKWSPIQSRTGGLGAVGGFNSPACTFTSNVQQGGLITDASCDSDWQRH